MDAAIAGRARVSASLYQRLGGAEGISAIVDEAVDRHAANPRLAPRFHGRDLPTLKALSLAFLSAGAWGTPPPDPGRVRPAHAGMRFAGHELDAVIDDMVAAMLERGVGAVEMGEVVGLLLALACDEPRCADESARVRTRFTT